MSNRPALSEYCPLGDGQLDHQTCTEMRDYAAVVWYSDSFAGEMSDVGRKVQEEFGVGDVTAGFVLNCLNRIQRNNCQTCAIGKTKNSLGIVARNP